MFMLWSFLMKVLYVDLGIQELSPKARKIVRLQHFFQLFYGVPFLQFLSKASALFQPNALLEVLSHAMFYAHVLFKNLLLMQMHRFAVHVITRSRKHPSQLVPCEYLFGHKDPETCKSLVEHLSACINNEQDRPKNLMVVLTRSSIYPLSLLSYY